MKIFHGTTYGVDLHGESSLWIGRRKVPVSPTALAGMVEGRLGRASVTKVGDEIALNSENVRSNVTHSDQAALVIVDTPLVDVEPFSVSPVRGDCRALVAQTECYMTSAGFTPAAAILSRFHGLLVMEPGSCMEIKESYGRFALLDWIDNWRGIHSGTTRFVFRVHVSYDGRSVKIEKQPMERVIS
ncbi:hypothetical protein BH11CYA1_BH11CYA1_08120 [soil metagenome]